MRARRGVSLIEVMVALTLFALIATVHTAATMRYGLQARVAALGQARASALSTAVDLYSTMPRNNILSNIGCSTINDIAQYPHQLCNDTTSVNSTIMRLRIRIVPSNTDLRPDTAWVDRVIAGNVVVFQ